MNKKIDSAIIQTLVNGYNISFYLQDGTLSAFQVNRHPGTSHTISLLNIPSHIGDIPVTSIADFGFVETDTLLLITIPDTITYLGERAFTGCIKLADITIPGSVKSIPFSLLEVKLITFLISTYSITGVIATIMATLEGSSTLMLTFPGELEILLPS